MISSVLASAYVLFAAFFCFLLRLNRPQKNPTMKSSIEAKSSTTTNEAKDTVTLSEFVDPV